MTSPPGLVSPDLSSDDTDSLTVETERPAAPQLPWHARLGLSWSTGAIPVLLIVAIGVMLGPQGLALLTPRVLDVIDPVIPVAVAALGVLAGFELTRPADPDRWGLLGKATIQATLTGALVIAGIGLLAPGLVAGAPAATWIGAIVLGLGASMSASLPTGDPDHIGTPLMRVRDLDAIVPVLAGAVVLASLHQVSWAAAVLLALQAGALAALVSATAWLLLSDQSSSTEQRVFSLAALLLVGGIADYLSLSALAGGLVAGLFWGVVGGAARDFIERDVSYLRHPLVVLMLLAAGARTTFSTPVLALGAAYLVLRVAGKLAGGWLVRRLPGVAIARDAGPFLLPPGVFGVAFVLNAAPMLGENAQLLLSAAVIGSIGAQVTAAIMRPGRAGA